MIPAVAIQILPQILLVVVGPEAFSFTEITRLSRRGHAAGRHSVDVDVDPAVDQTSVRSEQCPSCARTDLSGTAALQQAVADPIGTARQARERRVFSCLRRATQTPFNLVLEARP